MTTRFRRIVRTLTLIVVFTNLLSACGDGGSLVATATFIPDPTQLPVATTVHPPFPKTIDLFHELLSKDDAMTEATQCPHLLTGMEDGIILGIDQQTCEINENSNTQAVFHFYVPPEYVNNVFTIEISWPDDGFHGLRASVANLTAQIELDGIPFWNKRAFTLTDNGFFYAARSGSVLLTMVPKQSRAYSIGIKLPAGMAWDIGSIQLTASPLPKNLLGIAYSPYRDCQDANTKDQPSVENIESDLIMLGQGATAIRTYSSTGANGQIPSLANQLGIPVYAGVWLDGDMQSDKQEMDGIINIARTSQVEAVIIGNEYYLRHRSQADVNYLVEKIKDFKAHSFSIPVGTAEIDSFVFDWSANNIPTINPTYKPVLDEIDILFIHIYPFWAGSPLDGAAVYTVDRYLAIKTLLDGEYGGTKRLIIGEAGWPSQGGPGYGDYGGGYSGSTDNNISQSALAFHPEAQQKYMLELLALAHEYQVELFYFDAFDELWKAEGVNGAGRSWGYYYSDRTLKYNFSSLLLSPDMISTAMLGDTYVSYSESDFNWGIGSYPIYTEWPSEPKGRSDGIPDIEPYLLAYMGDLTDIEIFQCARNSHSGQTALKVEYQPNVSDTSDTSDAVEQLDWSGAYWLYPENNWGVSAKGMDVSDAQAITFWARGDKGGETVEFVTGGICGKYDGKNLPLCPDTIQPRVSTGSILLTSQWQKYTLSLNRRDRTNVIGAFGFSASSIYNPNGATFYLDDIAFAADVPTVSENVYPLPISSTFNIYTDYTALDNHYIPSNFMGDAMNAGNFSLALDASNASYSGDTSIRVNYQRGANGWAGVYWTDPEGNWGQRPGGYDLTGVTRLSFWARTERPGQQIKILVGGISCFKDKTFPYHDSVCDVVPIPWFTLTNEWKQYSVDLTSVQRDWSRLLGGFGFVVSGNGTLYLDDIIYHFDK